MHEKQNILNWVSDSEKQFELCYEKTISVVSEQV